MLSIFKFVIYSFGLFNESLNNYINDMNNKNLTYKLKTYNFEYKSNGHKFIGRNECHNCFNEHSFKRKNGFRERQRQINRKLR